MNTAESSETLLRIERGQATEEELAAVAVTLFSMAARQGPGGREDYEDRSAACWYRQRTGLYQAPHSWR